MSYSIPSMVQEALNIDPDIQKYSTFSTINATTNEDLVDAYSTIDVQKKNILIPASSGDQFLTAKILGAGTIIIYDINLLTKFFTFLKIGAYKHFNDFNRFQQFIVPRKGNAKFLNFGDFYKIANYLPEQSAMFWDLYLRKCNDNQLCNLLPPINEERFQCLKKFTPFYSQEGFEKYKELVDSLEYPEFVLSDLKSLPNYFMDSSKKFDFIDCSNIIECEVCQEIKKYLFPDCFLENALEDEWISFIQNQLSEIVSSNGKVIVDYRLDASDGLDYQSDLLFHHSELTPYPLNSNYPKDKSAIVVYQKK